MIGQHAVAMSLTRAATMAYRPLQRTRSPLQCSYMALSTFFRRKASSSCPLPVTSPSLIHSYRHIATSAHRHDASHSGTSSDKPAEAIPRNGSAAVPPTTPKSDLAKRSREDVLAHLSLFPDSLRRLAMSLPTSSIRRPTKEECAIRRVKLRRLTKDAFCTHHRLLASTSSFFERLRIRFKWFTIRGFRRFRADDWSAFVSWVVGGVGLWVIVGT